VTSSLAVFEAAIRVKSTQLIQSSNQIKSIYLPAQYRKTRLNMKPLIIQTRKPEKKRKYGNKRHFT